MQANLKLESKRPLGSHEFEQDARERVSGPPLVGRLVLEGDDADDAHVKEPLDRIPSLTGGYILRSATRVENFRLWRKFDAWRSRVSEKSIVMRAAATVEVSSPVVKILIGENGRPNGAHLGESEEDHVALDQSGVVRDDARPNGDQLGESDEDYVTLDGSGVVRDAGRSFLFHIGNVGKPHISVESGHSSYDSGASTDRMLKNDIVRLTRIFRAIRRTALGKTLRAFDGIEVSHQGRSASHQARIASHEEKSDQGRPRNEAYLLHGSQPHIFDGIAMQNFRVAPNNAAQLSGTRPWYSKGFYFSSSIETAHSYTRNKPNSDNLNSEEGQESAILYNGKKTKGPFHHMVVARVALGRMCPLRGILMAIRRPVPRWLTKRGSREDAGSHEVAELQGKLLLEHSLFRKEETGRMSLERKFHYGQDVDFTMLSSEEHAALQEAGWFTRYTDAGANAVSDGSRSAKMRSTVERAVEIREVIFQGARNELRRIHSTELRVSEATPGEIVDRYAIHRDTVNTFTV